MSSVRIIEIRELRQLLFQVKRSPEQHPIQAFSPNRADQSFDKWMGQRHIGNRLHLDHAQDTKVGLPLVKSVERIVIGSEALRHRTPSNGVVKHAAQRNAVDDSSMDTKAHDPPSILIHHHQNPMGSQEVRRPFSRSIENRQLVLDQERFGHHRTQTAGTQKPSKRRNEVNQKDNQVAHG